MCINKKQALFASFGLILCAPSLARAEDLMLAQADLLSLSLEELLAVEVETASKKAERVFDAPGVITVISAGEIEQFGANSLYEVLERVTSTYMMDAYMFPKNAMSMRGDSTGAMDTHILLLLNGRPFQDGLVGGLSSAIYLAYPLSAIERIEIVRGPGSVLYGTNAYAGVVNIISKKDITEGTREGLVSVGGGSLGTYSTEAWGGIHDGYFKLTGAVRYFEEDGWAFRAVDEHDVEDSMDYDETNTGAFLYGEYKNLTLNFAWLHTVHRHWGELPLWEWGAQDMDNTRLLVDLGYNHDFSRDWQLKANLTYNNRDTYFESFMADMAESSEDLQGEATLFWTGDKFSWLFGGTVFRTSGHTTADMKDGSGLVPFMGKNYETWHTVYTQADYRATDKVKFIAGAQSVKPAGLDWTTIPRVGLIYQFSDELGLKALYSRAYRGAAQFENGVVSPVVMGDPDLKPELIDTYDLQFMYHTQHHDLSLTYFHSKEQDLLTVMPVVGESFIRYTNHGEITLQGLEFEAKAKPTDKLYLTGSVTYQKNENADGIKNYTLMPNWLVKLGMNYTFDAGVSVGLFNSFVSHTHDPGIKAPWPVQYVNPKADAYNLMTLNLKADVGRLSGRLGKDRLLANTYVYNLLDEDIYTSEGVRGHINTIPAKQGRGIYVGLSYRF